MILRGEKLEEYRQMTDYWKKRLFEKDGTPKQYDIIRFTNGYGRHLPSFEIEYKGIDSGMPKWKWSHIGYSVYRLKLGEIKATYNISPKGDE